MAEAQANHRQELESSKFKSDASNERLGQIFAFVLSLVVIAGAFGLLASGRSLAGLSTLLATLVSLIVVFVYGRKSQTAERERKLKTLLTAIAKSTPPAS